MRIPLASAYGRLMLTLAHLFQRGEGEPEADGADEPDEADGADRKLRDASGIDDDGDLSKLKTGRPPRQPPTRTLAPAHLRRVDNP